MSVLRHQPDLDRLFDPEPARTPTMTAPSTNGHAASRLAELTAPAKGNNLGDILDQLAELDPAAIDAELEALNRRVAILKNLRGLVATGVTPGPKGEAPDVKPGGRTEEMQRKVLLILHRNGPSRTSQIASALKVNPKTLGRYLNKGWVRKGPGHSDPWSLTPSGKEEVRRIEASR